MVKYWSMVRVEAPDQVAAKKFHEQLLGAVKGLVTEPGIRVCEDVIRECWSTPSESETEPVRATNFEVWESFETSEDWDSNDGTKDK